MDEISLHVLDIIQNSIKAGTKKITLIIKYDENSSLLTIIISDNGCGMDQSYAEKVCDPFITSRTTRKVGMGLSLFKASAEGSGGNFKIQSKKGIGTEVTAIFNYKNIDCPPLGKMTETFITQVICNKDIDFIYKFITNKGEMDFDTREVKKVLGNEVELDNPDVINWMRNSIESELNDIDGGSLL